MPFNPDKHMSEYCSSDKYLLTVSHELGKLSGVIEGLTKKLDDVSENMITEPAIRNIVDEAIGRHDEKHHQGGAPLSVKQKAAIWGSVAAGLTGISSALTAIIGG